MHRVEYTIAGLDEKGKIVVETHLHGAFVHLQDASDAVVKIWKSGTPIHPRDLIYEVRVVSPAKAPATLPGGAVDPACGGSEKARRVLPGPRPGSSRRALGEV